MERPLLLCFCLATFLVVSAKAAMPIELLIKQFGYPVETHVIRTEDNYILTYHRIPRGKHYNNTYSHPVPVLLQHGILAASSCWVLSENALAYTLADAGFDVWLGNARGNTYSRNHVYLNPDRDSKAFWDFSWHEMGYYDLPASIDYILDKTGKRQLFYIGHSMGTTMYVVLGATRPQYMEKVKAAVLLAPVVFPWNVRSPLTKLINTFSIFVQGIETVFRTYEIMPYSRGLSWLEQHVCTKPGLRSICEDVLYMIGGLQGNDLKRIPMSTILEYMPAGASYKVFRHFRQLMKEGTQLQHYDHGILKNMAVYRSMFPPIYNINNVRSPIYLYYSRNDWLAVPQDVVYASNKLPNVQRTTQVPNDYFNHLDFMWALDAKTLLYDDVISTLQNHV